MSKEFKLKLRADIETWEQMDLALQSGWTVYRRISDVKYRIKKGVPKFKQFGCNWHKDPLPWTENFFRDRPIGALTLIKAPKDKKQKRINRLLDAINDGRAGVFGEYENASYKKSHGFTWGSKTTFHQFQSFKIDGRQLDKKGRFVDRKRLTLDGSE